MSSVKRVIVLFLSLIVAAGILSGCVPGNSGISGTSGSLSDQPGKSQDASTTGNEKPSYFNETGYPIVNEPLTLTMMGSQNASHGPWDKMYVFTEFEKKSGIHIEWITAPDNAYVEKKNLALASNDLPDAFYRGMLTAQDIVMYGSQKVLIPLNDLVDKYAPNITRAFRENQGSKEAVTTPDGLFYTIPEINGYSAPRINWFIWINKAWLDKLNIDIPTTTEEYYQALKAFKEMDPNGNNEKDEIPLSGAWNRFPLINLKGSFGLGTTGDGDYELDKDGNLFYSRIDPRYKELLQYMNRLYSEGLMDQEILTMESSHLKAKTARDIVGSFCHANPDSAGLTADKAEDYQGLPCLEGPHGDKIYSRAGGSVTSIGTFAITRKNKYPEATIRWVDFWFSDEGSELIHGGEKGKTYEILDSGLMQYTDFITKNPDGLSTNQAIGKYTPWPGSGIPRIMVEKFDPSPKNYPISKAARSLVEPFVPKEIWPTFILTPEEQDIMNTIGNDIRLYVEEMEAKFMLGEEPFTSWDKYVENVKKMGLDQVLKVQQAAYDRYKKTR